jgi:hypothetical protein
MGIIELVSLGLPGAVNQRMLFAPLNQIFDYGFTKKNWKRPEPTLIFVRCDSRGAVRIVAVIDGLSVGH